ncbi:MAG: MBL fold metallo-hydrolase [Lachnospiraceae bacterium]|nr:MBL fold metallo-hydrolase [Lachnospiraceae bacterium]
MTDFKVTQINDNTWRIDEGIVRYFLLTGQDKALLIDGGRDNGNARDVASGLTDLPLELIVTHADGDHCRSNGQFDWFYMHPAEASNYFNIQHSIGEFRPVYDGNVIDLGGRPLEIIHVPGHTPGSIAVLDINARALFSGDTVQDGNVYLFGIEREFRAYTFSLERLEQLKDRYDVIYPCHGNIPLGADHVPRLLECAREVINGRKKPVTEIVWEQEISKYEFDCGTFLCEKAEHY